MLRRIGTRIRCDEGMSVLEVVLAAVVLFFVLTATLGLVGGTTRTNQSAQARVVMTNTVSSHVEWARSLDFDQIGIVGSTPEAAIPARSVYTDAQSGMTVTIDNSVRNGVNGTKELRITASAVGPNNQAVTMSTVSAICDRNTTMTNISNANEPDVLFTSASVPNESTVYGSYTLGGAPLNVETRVEVVVPEAVISELHYYCGDQLLRNGNSIFSDVASWNPGTPAFQQAFRWDTRQVDDAGVATIQDGWRVIRIVAVDSEGNQGSTDRRVYVDNFPPGPPVSIAVEGRKDTETRLSWPVVQDGTDAALKYEVQVTQYNLDGSQAVVGSYIVEDPAYLHYCTPFSQYTASVRAGSPRNLWSDWLDMGSSYISRFAVTGSSTTVYAGKNAARTATTNVSLAWITPNFPHYSVTYDVFRSMDPANMGTTPWKTDVGTSFSETITKLVGKFGAADPWHYQVRANVKFTAAGTSVPVLSNVVGPIAADGTLPMASVRW